MIALTGGDYGPTKPCVCLRVCLPRCIRRCPCPAVCVCVCEETINRRSLEESRTVAAASSFQHLSFQLLIIVPWRPRRQYSFCIVSTAAAAVSALLNSYCSCPVRSKSVTYAVRIALRRTTRSQAVARIADRTASQHISGSLDDIGHVTNWHSICHFLVVVLWNQASIFNGFRDIQRRM